MIYVSQGHELGIGLEIFLKSFILLDSKSQDLFTLSTHKDSLISSLDSLSLDYKIKNNVLFLNNSKLRLLLFDNSRLPQSTSSLLQCMEKINDDRDILVTLPTSKDQLVLDGEALAGHTEFFRRYYKNSSIAMIFRSFNENILLITDHVALKNVSKSITSSLLISKTQISLNGFKKYFSPISRVCFSGINPHSGENGILGAEDILIVDAIDELKTCCAPTLFTGPHPGDTLHLIEKSINNLIVYMYHDQGLSKFKSENQFIGSNLSFGLPFLRLSVDHGTAFELYGKRCANYQGALFTLKTALEVHNRISACG